MPDNEALMTYIKQHIDGKRLAHSIGTANEAVKLARKYGADETKAYAAGLLHDVAKGMCKIGFQNLAKEYGIIIDNAEAKISS